MISGRMAELKYLNGFYERSGSHMLVVYGQKHVGKTAVLKEFTKNRSFFYDLARACSEKGHLTRLGRELAGLPEEEAVTFSDILERLPRQTEKKKRILILDEFQNIVKVSPDFIREVIFFVQTRQPSEEVLVILSSSSVGWVENSMISNIGKAAHALSGLYKIKESGFFDMREIFPDFTPGACVEAYAVLGGLPGLWRYFDSHLTIKENICKNILDPGSFLHAEAERCVSEELRETSVYNTILAALASGRRKLNELYLHTGFSRAKISVYLKNLIELELVEKVFSFDSEGRDNTCKGIYRIRNHFVNFYFTFLYASGGKLFSMQPSRLYDIYIAPELKKYTEEYYKKICMQYVDWMNRTGRLPFHFSRMGEWIGKTGSIDMIAQDEKGQTLIGQCRWEASFFRYEEYNRLMACAAKAKVKPDYVFLFSFQAFEDRLIREAELSEKLWLFGPDKI